MAIPISNVTRRVVYAASGTGPYAFTFEILANTDIAVYRDDTLLTLTTNYTVTINSNGTGSITLTAAPTGATQIAIVGNRTIQRTTDFVTGGDFFANTVNDEMDQQTIFAQQNAEGLTRSLQAPQTDPTTIDMTLPRASVRANKTLAFDANGDPTTGEVIGDNRGNWAAGVAYNKRDIIKDTSNGNIYYANTSHTSTGSQPISTNADSAKWDLIVDNASAGTSATAAAASASAASTSASNASTSASNASTSASNASTSASTASTQASNASTSATAAASSASAASSSATAASGSASTASTQASNASTSATNASNSASSASTSATNAAASASTATTQASNASTSATNAATSASAASTSASNAAASASSAASAQTAAEAARDSALAAYDNFDDRYLGAKSSNPALDNDGNALLAGALYYNTTVPEMRLYTGSAWVAAYVSGAGFVAQSSSTGSAYLPVGTTGQRDGSPSAGYLRFNTTTTQFEGYNGTAWSSVGGAVIVNDTSTSSNVYPLFASATSGTALTVNTGNAKLLYKPSTGELQASVPVALNGIVVNSQTVATSYTIAAGYSGMSAGPVTVASGQSVTVSSGSRWVVQ